MRKYDRERLYINLKWCISELKRDTNKRIVKEKDIVKKDNISKVNTLFLDFEKLLSKILRYEEKYLSGGKKAHGDTE